MNFLEVPRRNRRFDFLTCFIIVSLGICLHSLLRDWPDLEKTLQATMMITGAVQIVLRFALYFFNAASIPVCRDIIIKYYEDNDNDDSRKTGILNNHLQFLKFISKLSILIHSLSHYAPIAWSLAVFFIKGNLVYPLPIFLPFLDRFSSTGFIVNCFIQIIMNFPICCGNPTLEILYFLLHSQMKLFVDLIECDLDDFSTVLLTNQNSSKKERQSIRERLKNLIDKHRQISSYHKLMIKFVNNQFSVILFFNVYVVCACGISLLASEYSMAFSVAALYPIQIFIVCAFGTFISHQHQRLYNMLWKFEWNLLPCSEQKKFLFFMMNVQEELNLELFMLGVIDMKLFTQVRTLDLVNIQL